MFSLTIVHVLKVLVFTAACNNSCVALGTTNMTNNACVSICIGLEVSYYVHLSFSYELSRLWTACQLTVQMV